MYEVPIWHRLWPFKYRRTFPETMADSLSMALVGCGPYDTCFTFVDPGSQLSLPLSLWHGETQPDKCDTGNVVWHGIDKGLSGKSPQPWMRSESRSKVCYNTPHFTSGYLSSSVLSASCTIAQFQGFSPH